MGYQNWNFICFNCRTSYKGNALCASCGGKLVSTYYKIRVPKKRKIKEWEKLKVSLKERSPYLKHEIDCQEKGIAPDPLFSEYGKSIVPVEKKKNKTMNERIKEHDNVRINASNF